jgi:hypothetical protein
MEYTMIHAEWWTELQGIDVMTTILNTAHPYIIDDGCFLVSDDSVLKQTGEEFGENELMLTIATKEEDRETLWDVIKPAVNAQGKGIRIKTTASIPAELSRADSEALWKH